MQRIDSSAFWQQQQPEQLDIHNYNRRPDNHPNYLSLCQKRKFDDYDFINNRIVSWEDQPVDNTAIQLHQNSGIKKHRTGEGELFLMNNMECRLNDIEIEMSEDVETTSEFHEESKMISSHFPIRNSPNFCGTFSKGNSPHANHQHSPNMINNRSFHSNCWYCKRMANCQACSYCDKISCDGGCLKYCENCGNSFCTACTMIDYSHRYDRILCLDCYYSK
jgi:hypothetical protein